MSNDTKEAASTPRQSPVAHQPAPAADGAGELDAVAKAIADVIGHGMREKCIEHARAAIAALRQPAPRGFDDMSCEHELLAAGKGLREAMAMVEKRKSGEFHINPATAARVWEDAKSAWDSAIESCKRNEGAMAPLDAESIAALRQPSEKVTDAMVRRFLSWRLPGHIKPDGVYPPKDAPYPMTGTNLLDYDAAKAMLEYVLTDMSPTAQLKRVLDEAFREDDEETGTPPHPAPSADVGQLPAKWRKEAADLASDGSSCAEEAKLNLDVAEMYATELESALAQPQQAVGYVSAHMAEGLRNGLHCCTEITTRPYALDDVALYLAAPALPEVSDGGAEGDSHA